MMDRLVCACLLLLSICVAASAVHWDDPKIKVKFALDPARPKGEKNDEYFSSKMKRDWFSIRQDTKSPECFFSGYKPNGPIVNIAKIESPKATLGAKSGLAKILSGAKKMGQGAAVAMHAMKFSATLMKSAPMLGPALGVFAAATAIINPKPTAQDILNSVNTAVAKLTSEVNQKLDQMKGYVDSKIAKLEKDLVTGEYASSFRLWAGCIKEPTADLVKVCQRDAIKHLIANRPKFAPLAAELMSSKAGISFENVRKLEAYMLAFRDYANLVVMELTPLLEYYCVAKKNIKFAPHYCDVYSTSLAVEAQFFIDYATRAIKLIKDGHWGTSKMGNCPNTIKCDAQKAIKEGFWNAHTANWQKCRCEIESSNTKKFCEIKFTLRYDGQRVYTNYNYNGIKSLSGAGVEYAGRVLKSLAKTYQVKNHQIMDKYWQEEILSFIPEWRKAVEIAKVMKAKNPKKSKDAPSMDFSQGFANRLVLSGYKSVAKDTTVAKRGDHELDAGDDEFDDAGDEEFDDGDEEFDNEKEGMYVL